MGPRPAPVVLTWAAKYPATDLFTTAITEAEIFHGIELLSKGKRREGLRAAAEAMFVEDLAGRVLGFDSEAARGYSRIAAERRSLGKPISHADAQIAAIARARGPELATRNVSDFANCNVKVVDPWSEP